MDDQVFAEDLSLESLIREGRVTHLCSGEEGLDETAVLTALCDAVGGQIYRIDPLTYVFRIGEDDLGGALAGAPVGAWADALARRLRTALSLPAGAAGLHVRALRRESAGVAQEPAEPESAAPETPDPDPAPEHDPRPVVDLAPDPDGAPEPDHAPEADVASEADFTPGPDFPPEPEDDGGVESTESASVGTPAADAEPAAEAPGADPAPEAVEARLDALELRLGELQSCLSDVAAKAAAQAAAQAEAARSLERMIDELVQENRHLPERAAEHMAAQTSALAPLSLSLTDALRKLEEGTASGPAPDLEPVREGLERLADEIAGLSRRLEAQPSGSEDVVRRLDRFDEDLRGLPERAAVHVAACMGSLAPMHVALSGALHRLERRIEALTATPKPEPDADLRLAMAEFLSRMEQRLAIRPLD